jgi:hypothetical protein
MTAGIVHITNMIPGECNPTSEDNVKNSPPRGPGARMTPGCAHRGST